MAGVFLAVLNNRNTAHVFFSEENVTFVQNKISEVLKNEFKQKIVIDRASIKRKMVGVFEERLESIPRMNQRLVMKACHEFRIDQAETERNLRWEVDYVGSQMLIDDAAQMVRYDPQNIKLSKGVGGTLRFYFT